MHLSQNPYRRSLRLVAILSLAAALLTAAVSLAGLIFQDRLYPSQALRQTFVSNDAVNLLICLPALLASMALARRGRLLGLLAWPGALMVLFYNAVAYAVAMPLTPQFAAYLALVILSAATIVLLMTGMDRNTVQDRLAGAVRERLAGGVLTGLGALFFLRAVGLVIGALSGQSPLGQSELPALVADFAVMPAWVIGGVALWRKQPSGYISGLGLLFQGSLLFIGLLAFFILQPFLAGLPFPLTDFLVILVMGLVCFVPFGLYARGVMARGR